MDSRNVTQRIYKKLGFTVSSFVTSFFFNLWRSNSILVHSFWCYRNKHRRRTLYQSRRCMLRLIGGRIAFPDVSVRERETWLHRILFARAASDVREKLVYSRPSNHPLSSVRFSQFVRFFFHYMQNANTLPRVASSLRFRGIDYNVNKMTRDSILNTFGQRQQRYESVENVFLHWYLIWYLG